MRFLAFLWVALLATGCAGVGVVSSSDPLRKLNDADDLLFRQHRPLIAERLIMEAMTIYQKQNDSHGLGHAHRSYADLLLSPPVAGQWAKYYEKNGFQDRTVTYGNRAAKASEYHAKAVEHYVRAADQHRAAHRYDALSNVYFNMGSAYAMLNDRTKACRFYDEALWANNENIKRNPNAKQYASKMGSFADLLAAKKKHAACA